MALQVVEAGLLGGGHHGGVQLLVAGDEGDVHQAAVLGHHGALEQLGGIQEVIDDLGLGDVALFHFLQTADAQQILEHLAAAVDGPAVGGVVHAVVVGMGLILHVNGGLGIQVVPDQILPDDDHGHAGGAHVLLHAGPDQTVVGHVAGPGQEHGGLVGHQHVALGVGQLVPGGAVDGLVLADIDVVGVLGNVQVGAVGDVGEVLVGGGGNHLHLAVLLGLGNGLLGPCAGLHIAGLAVLHQVHGHHGELQGAAALDKQDLVVIGDVHQLAQVGLGLVGDLLEHLGAVAHLHDAHAAAAVVHHLVADLLQHGLRHHSRTGGEVESTTVFHLAFPPDCCNR